MDFGKIPLNEELYQRCDIKNVVTFLKDVTEESLIKNPKNQEIIFPINSLSFG
ncbi:MAG: hypothetical protein ACFFEY_15770 [Candidatus Thorarchaeota archaeon]